MLKGLGGHPIIEWVLRRAGRSRSLDGLVLATTDSDVDDPLADFSQSLSIPVYRGSENDVLGRFVGASRKLEAQIVVRICADNPFVAPEEIDRAVSFFLSEKPDYAFNHMPRMNNRYPDGLGVEVIEAELLELINQLSLEAKDREHVTSYLWDHPSRFQLAAVPCPPEIQDHDENIKLDIDTPADWERLEKMAGFLKFDSEPREILKVWRNLYNQKI